MKTTLISKIILIVAVVGLALYSALPLSERINLGLDLQGGMHLALEVDTVKALEGKLDVIVNAFRADLNNAKLVIGTVERSGNQINVTLPYAQEKEPVQKYFERHYDALEVVREESNLLVFAYPDIEAERLQTLAVSQALETIRNRIDQFGVAEPTIQKQGQNRIIVELPGVKDPDRATELIGRTAVLEFKMVNESVSPQDAMAGFLPDDLMLAYQRVLDPETGQEVGRTPYVLTKVTPLSGNRLVDAEVRINSERGDPYVGIKFDPEGARIFADLTARNVGNRMAIVLDGNVYSAPVINERIGGGEASISGRFTMEDARDLAIVLRSGSLPAPVEIIENRTVGPTLGQDSIDKGVRAGLSGLVLVLLFMIAYYRLSGVIANVALIVNVIILLGMLAYFGATLTLPGIAGIILTIGMAVDANVLIFERIREELGKGATPRNAIQAGYDKVFSTIFDANITTLIAAVVLFQFGSGPVKGFAITLSIGILASMFTAIVCTRVVYEVALAYRPIKKLSV